jgi:hypothetical protein
MKKKPKATESNGSVSETIIATQSFFLLAFGLAGVMATSYVVAGFNALRDVNSAVAIVTDAGIQTETETVSVEAVRGIINNFQLVGISVSAFGSIVFAATCIRLYNRNKLKSTKVKRRKS